MPHLHPTATLLPTGTLSDTASRTAPAQRHRTVTATAAALCIAALCSAPGLRAEALDYIQVGPMYMAYFDLNAGNNGLLWQNADSYATDGPQVLRPLSLTSPDDYYTGTSPWAQLLNPVSQGGANAASSRLFGFSLSGNLRNYLRDNGYAFAIQLESITFAGSTTEAGNASVFYYNRGNDDWGSSHADKVAWAELTDQNYLVWNGQSFSNMIHPLIVSTDPLAVYTLTYTVTLVDDITGANVNAEVLANVTGIGGFTPLTFSYDVSAVPEPATVALSLGAAALAATTLVRRAQRRSRHTPRSKAQQA